MSDSAFPSSARTRLPSARPRTRPRRVSRTISRTLRLIATAGLLGLTLTISSWSSAEAHNTLVSTDPTDRSSVAATPSSITLTFDEPAIAMGTQLIVSGPAGPVQIGTPTLVDNTVRQALQGGSPAGDYTVNWRVTSDDGHPISGTFTFTAEAAGTGTATPTSSPTPVVPTPSDTPTITRIVLAGLLVLLVVCAVAVALPRIRRRHTRR